MIGGAAMMFEYDAGRETEDVDCIIEDYREEVIEAAEQVAAEEPGIPYDWLNEDARRSKLLPTKPDPDKRDSYNGSRITVTSAGARRLLAMKLDSNREKDVEDILTLLKITSTVSVSEAQDVYAETYGEKAFPDEAAQIVERIRSEVEPDSGSRGAHATKPERPTVSRHDETTGRPQSDKGWTR